MSYLDSDSKRLVTTLAVVCWSSWIAMETLVFWGAWTLMTPSHRSVICTQESQTEPFTDGLNLTWVRPKPGPLCLGFTSPWFWFWSQSHLVSVVPVVFPSQQSGCSPAQVPLFLIGRLVQMSHLRQEEVGDL